MANVDDLINYWSEALSERLIEIRYIDMDEMKAAMTVHFKSALVDCLKIQISETEKKLVEAKLNYQNYGGGKNNYIQIEIIGLKKKLKEQNKLFYELEGDNFKKEMIKWMRINCEKQLLDFYDYYNTNFPKPNQAFNPSNQK